MLTKEEVTIPMVAKVAPRHAVIRIPNLSTRILANGDRKKVIEICKAPTHAEREKQTIIKFV